MNKKTKIIFITSEICVCVVFGMILPAIMSFNFAFDVDYIENGEYTGNYLVTDGGGKIVIVDRKGQLLWKTELAEVFVHDADILPDGNIMIGDLANDRVIVVNISDPDEIIWEWDARNIDDIDWEAFGVAQGWNEEGIAYITDQNPPHKYWTHLNDADWINKTQYGFYNDTILVSLRNFDLIVEVNYSDTKEIVWWYGEPCNHEYLYKQHNPDRLPNNNTIICDSENHKIIEINYTTKQIEWEFELEFPNGQLRWARDCDDMGDGRYLITDSTNARLLIIDRETKQIEKIIHSPLLFQVYDADYTNGKIIAGEYLSGIVLIDPESGWTTGLIGFPTYIVCLIYILAFLTGYYYYRCIDEYRNVKKKGFLQKFRDYRVYHYFIYGTVILTTLVILPSCMGFFWHYGIQVIVDYFIN
ncbi:MAG: hypothetical protein GF364_18575 [Candidatus Lokiarchaeota archaeon]|nr:hypothetical protein [Candidatus Lokiarchaeota archaeon]